MLNPKMLRTAIEREPVVLKAIIEREPVVLRSEDVAFVASRVVKDLQKV